MEYLRVYTDGTLEFVRFFFDVFAVIAVFEGTRRVRKVGFSWRTGRLFIFGAIWSIGFAGLSFFVASTMGPLKRHLEPTHVSGNISNDWGNKLSPPDREKNSRILASVDYRGGALDAKFIDASGTIHAYCPTPEDIVQRDNWKSIQQRAYQSVDDALDSGVRRLVTAILAALIGWLASNKKYADSLDLDS